VLSRWWRKAPHQHDDGQRPAYQCSWETFCHYRATG
jgi:hypothetical protein